MGILQLVDENGKAVEWSVIAPKLTAKDKSEIVGQVLREITQVIDSWKTVQKIVRAGKANQVFKIGDQFECQHSQFGTLKWEIIGINHDTPADSQYQHSITLQLHDCLPQTLQFDAPEPTNLNSNRREYGSNRWSESGIRQWLNSDAEAGSWWKAKTQYDAAPSYASTMSGFLKGLDEDFLSVVGEVRKVTAKNSVTDGGGNETSTEKFFLLSKNEVYGGLNNDIAEGATYSYYANNSDLSSAGVDNDENRIKYRNGALQIWAFVRLMLKTLRGFIMSG